MSQHLLVITEASDLYFHFTRTAIFTFINKNPQFTGKIQLMVHPELPLSQGNFETLKLLYSSIEKIQVDSIFSNLKTSLPGRLDKIYSSLKLNVFTLATQNTIYFSSISISINSILPILKDKSICRSLDWSVIYIASSREDLVDISKNPLLVESPTISDALSQILPDFQVFANTEIVLASTATDQKFTQLGHTLNNSRIIVYDNITRSSPNYSKINRVWLEKNKISGTTVAKLSIPVKLAKPRPVKVDRTLHQKNSSHTKFQRSNRVPEEADNLSKINIDASLPNSNYSVACVIAFYGRHSILEITVDLLSKQSLVPAVILVASNQKDAQFAATLSKKYSNIFITFHSNHPLGAKWAAGVKYAKTLNVSGLLILGSDDVISSDYINYCFSNIGKGKGSSAGYSDCIGTRNWYMYDCATADMYSLRYAKNDSIFIGAGRMFSKFFLDSINWDIFKIDLPSGLDSYGYTQVQQFSNKFKEADLPHIVISIKGKWEMLNSSMKILKSKTIISKKLTKDTSTNILTTANIIENLRYLI